MQKVLFLTGSRRLNTRIAMFAQSLHAMGYGVSVLSPARHRWSCQTLDPPLELEPSGRWSASLGGKPDGKVRLVVCFHWMMLPVAVAIGKLTGAPVIYDEHDHYELNTLEGSGPPIMRRFFQVAIKAVHRAFIPFVSLVTCIHQKGEVLAQRLRNFSPHVIELGNFPDGNWQPGNPTPTSGQLHFVYAGGVYAEKGVMAAFRAVAAIEISHPGLCHLDIFGPGDPHLLATIAGVQGVAIHGEVTSSSLRQFLAGHRAVGLAVLARSPRYDLVGTNLTKLYEYLAAGLPVIASESGETGAFVRENGVGLVITDASDIAGMEMAMSRLCTDKALFEKCAAAASDLMRNPEMRWDCQWGKVVATGVLNGGKKREKRNNDRPFQTS